jgi:hypothetical protein
VALPHRHFARREGHLYEYLPGTLTPWTEHLTNFVLEFTAMTLNLKIHPEARRTSTVAADSWILSNRDERPGLGRRLKQPRLFCEYGRIYRNGLRSSQRGGPRRGAAIGRHISWSLRSLGRSVHGNRRGQAAYDPGFLTETFRKPGASRMVKILVVPAAPRMNLTSSEIRSATAVLD